MLTMLFGWLLGMGQAVPEASSPAPRNAGFEEPWVDGTPAGWMFSKSDPKSDFKVESADGSAGTGARLYRASGDSAGTATIAQNIDAAPFRGKLVRLSARFAVAKPGAHVGLGLAVTRPQPKFVGFYYGMEDRPILAGTWTDYAIVGRVAPDATRIRVSTDVSGDADAIVDELKLDVVAPDTTPPSNEAKAYLDRAIDLIRANHIDSGTADWKHIGTDAEAEIGGATTVGDTHNAIRGVLGALGEKHSFLRIPTKSDVTGEGSATPKPPLPVWALLDGRFGVMRLPGLNTYAPDGAEHGNAYQATIQEGLQALDTQQICGWVVDARENDGGNMWPMLQDLDPLLGAPPFGSFVDAKREVTFWQRQKGRILSASATPQNLPPAYPLKHAGAPIAVLLGPRTASSGEMAAMALIGRANVRTFGEPSAGYTTGNSVFPLSDGALLILTEVFVRDRAGKDYQGEIQPDVKTTAADAQSAALHWLAAQCSRS